MTNLTSPIIGLLFLQKKSTFLNMRQGVLKFPSTSMQLKNADNTYSNLNEPLLNPTPTDSTRQTNFDSHYSQDYVNTPKTDTREATDALIDQNMFHLIRMLEYFETDRKGTPIAVRLLLGWVLGGSLAST